ncbi:MAG TPA: hypothetical protein VEH84_07495 [Alphaproteobacteria bacterium]|nr:hypothetical protein [Alphaproteobacteria bacterium]
MPDSSRSIAVAVDGRARAWQAEAAGLARAPLFAAGPERRAGWLWRRLALRCPPLAEQAQRPSPLPDGVFGTVLDLTAAGDLPPGRGRVWRLTVDGAPLAAPLPGFAASGRGAVHAVALEEATARGRRVIGQAVIGRGDAGYGRFLPRLYATALLLLRRALAGAADEAPAEPPAAAPARALPAALLAYALRRLAERARAVCLTERWSLGIVDAPIASIAQGGLPPVRWLRHADPGLYLADPFPAPEGERLYCEVYDVEGGQGRIAALELEGDRIATLQPLDLPLAGHLSYPYTWSHDGRTYGVAESCASRRLVIFVLDAAGGWRPVAELPGPIAAADPTLFAHEGRVWLAYADADIDAMASLCLWHAPHPEGPWTPHAGNPVKIDLRSARPGGTPFLHGGRLYRPAQDCSAGYGGALALNRIVACTPDRFVEATVRVLQPDPASPYPDGLHTLSAWRGRTLVDGKRLALEPRDLLRRAGRRLLPRRLWA